ncbi:MAG: heme-copper oxidase subunit III [Acidimicrobiaceae bacterium]|nr:heme-copper oxidase subunit III [Acidimicrobiaceae bacterium]
MAQAVVTQTPKVREPIRFNKPSMLGVGTMVWLGSELMFFSGLFAAYFTVRANRTGAWPPPGIKLDIAQSAVFTVILVMSSVTMQKAVFEAEHGRKRSARWWIVLTMVMGLSFLSNQAVEWTHVTFSTSTNAYGSMFFVMTGLHGLHVLLGIVAMGFLMLRLAGSKSDPGELAALQSVSYYWHFVDVVWVALYAVLFLIH